MHKLTFPALLGPPLLICFIDMPRDSQYNFAQQLASFTRSVVPLFEHNPQYAWAAKHLIEPERVIHFRVPWTDDDGHPRINRGFRVQVC